MEGKTVKVYFDGEIIADIPLKELVSIESNNEEELLVFYTKNNKLQCITCDNLIFK